MTATAVELAEGFGISRELFDAICRTICPPDRVVESDPIEIRYPQNIRARALHLCRYIADARLDLSFYGDL